MLGSGPADGWDDLVEEEEEELPDLATIRAQERRDYLLDAPLYRQYIGQLFASEYPVESHRTYAEVVAARALILLATSPGGRDLLTETYGITVNVDQVRRFIDQDWLHWPDRGKMLERFYDEVEGGREAVAALIETYCYESRQLVREINYSACQPGSTTVAVELPAPLPDEPNWEAVEQLASGDTRLERAAWDYLQDPNLGMKAAARKHRVRYQSLVHTIKALKKRQTEQEGK
ncbi:hypothetical protein NITHO_2310001 [Nitrolancea hollandica Lb]|uniref:Uncharacterized protein n=1 Tax=Nitrolancea hollandica Lb TaxID=1129897 RepID=I4EFJ6_9BACT|nr:hypothetical protein NITHO_2310001 [Nitrolancea hollandica Lb]